MYTKVLALELAPCRINVNAIYPGTIETDFQRDAGTHLAAKVGLTYDQFIESTLAAIPLGRIQAIEDVANSAAWLVSPEADYVTGVHLLTTGEQTMD